jgi:hypothetical protein
VFPTPGCQRGKDRLVSWKLDYAYVSCQTESDYVEGHKNPSTLLWPTKFVPVQQRQVVSGSTLSYLCDSVHEVPAHLLLCDENDGFRLTWIRESTWEEDGLPLRVVEPIFQQQQDKGQRIVRSSAATRIVILDQMEYHGWRRCVSDRCTGAPMEADSTSMQGDGALEIAFSGFFSIAALLQGILCNRPNLVQPRFGGENSKLPNYSYHMVGLYQGGRVALVLVLFSVGPVGKGCVGCFVEVDLFTQDFIETEFIRQSNVDTPPPSCAALALSRHKHRSPRSVKDERAISECAPRLAQTWSEMHAKYYPNCQTLDNAAVRRQIPVQRIVAANAPVEIVYG